MATKKTESPMMKQFLALKEKHPDALLLFRCGDFYETYGEDAKECAKVLGITLTYRNDDKTPMAGFPYHALDPYLPKLIRAGKRVAICDQLEDPKLTKRLVKRGITEQATTATNNSNNNQNSSKTMAKKTMAKNESANVQTAAQVNNPAIEDVNVGEVTLDTIMPTMTAEPVKVDEYTVKDDKGNDVKFESVIPAAIVKAANEGTATTMPLGSHGTLVIAGVGGEKPKVTLRKKGSTKFDLEKDKPEAPETCNLKPETISRVRLVTYTTKRGETAPRIVGFTGEDDPRWKRHYDERMRLAKEKKEADAFNEKLQAKMKGKSKEEREKMRKQWKSVGSDPFGASYFTDRTTGEKFYQMTMGAKYLDVARRLVEAYNSGDEQAIAAAEQSVIDTKAGIVSGYQAEREAKRAERKAERAAKAAAEVSSDKFQVSSEPAAPAMSDEDRKMFDLFKRFMAGDKEVVAMVNAKAA